MKKLVSFFLKNKALSVLLLVLVVVGGLISYVNMGKLEDAPFTIKQALVTTPYPGASAMEVQQQVTDVLEEAIQSLGELYYLKTDNRAGLSKITVYVKKEIRADEMQQLWDKLRRKVNDVQSRLPEGAGPSTVNDDFGDVLGVFYSLSSSSHTYREMDDMAKAIKNEILSVKDVAKVELFGVQNRTIEIQVNSHALTESGLTMADIASAFVGQNKIVDVDAVETETNRLRVEAGGAFSSVEEIENLTVVSKNGDYFRLGDIALVCQSYVHPARNKMKTGNVPSIGIAISTVSDGNFSQDRLEDLMVWNGVHSAPLAQLTDSVSLEWEFPLVRTYNRELSMAAQCDVKPGHTMKEVHSEIREEIENMKLPQGYTFFWDSQYKDQKEAMEALTRFFPLAIVLLTVILVALFNNFRQPLIIFLILPLSLIGVVVGLLVTGFQFGFFCIAGWLGLLGMIIKNVIVLLDEVNIQRREGVPPYQAVVEATVSRARPVLMAAITTICGSIPLLFDVVFGGMAATIVFGLSFATLLTLFVTPALYAIFYKIRKTN